MKNPYEVLGVAKNASSADIKKAYKKLAMKHHPDKNQGKKDSEEKFKDISQAYDTIGDEKKRKEFDSMENQERARRSTPNNRENAGFDEGAFSDIFGNFMGGRNNPRPQKKELGEVSIRVNISLKDFVLQNPISFKFRRMETCKVCNESGCKSGANPVKCGTCHGQGSVMSQLGPFSMPQQCPTCHGSGSIIRKGDECLNCNGKGLSEVISTLSIKIPISATNPDHSTFVYKGEGHQTKNGNSDLIINVKIREDNDFYISKDELHKNIELTFAQAALGGSFLLETFSKKINVKIPAGIQTGQRLKIKNEGIARGDLFLSVKVVTPTNISHEQKRLIEELRKLDK